MVTFFVFVLLNKKKFLKLICFVLIRVCAMNENNHSILDLFFNPKSVAVIGASHNPNSLGHITFKNFADNKKSGLYKGELYPVNIKGGEILGYKVYKSVLDIPGDIDLGVIIVPAKFVPNVMEDCGKKGIKAVIIISAGFSEVGNVELEQRVLQIARKYGIRIIGPNGLGVTDVYSGVDTTFLPYEKQTHDGRMLPSSPKPKQGYMAFLSQSGSFGVAILDYMIGEDMGITKFVSYGNQVDVDDTDLIEYLEKDDRTKAILIYAESIKHGRKFVEVASRVSKKKPIIILKSGRTSAGARATASHTASVAGSDDLYEAAFKKAGCIRANTMEEMIDYAKALIYQPPAKGRNIAILTDGGGAGIVAADTAELHGLAIKPLPERVLEKFKELQKEGVLPTFATFSNPVDITGNADAEMYRASAEVLLGDESIDGMILRLLHHPPRVDPDIAQVMIKTIRKYNKPVTVCDIGSLDYARYIREELNKAKIPAYPTPERAAKAMVALVKYGEYLKKQNCL